MCPGYGGEGEQHQTTCHQDGFPVQPLSGDRGGWKLARGGSGTRLGGRLPLTVQQFMTLFAVVLERGEGEGRGREGRGGKGREGRGEGKNYRNIFRSHIWLLPFQEISLPDGKYTLPTKVSDEALPSQRQLLVH